MVKTLQARYIGGVLKPLQPLPLAEGAVVGITLTLPSPSADAVLSFKGMWAPAQVDALERALSEARAESAARAEAVATAITDAARPAQ